MLHTKFRGNRSTGSGEEDFEMFLAYMGVVAILVMWHRCREQTFVRLYENVYYDWPGGFREDV